MRLRDIATNAQEVERLKLENKIMRLEIQKMRIDNDGSQHGSEESMLSTDLTNGKLLQTQNKLKQIQPISKVRPTIDTA